MAKDEDQAQGQPSQNAPPDGQRAEQLRVEEQRARRDDGAEADESGDDWRVGPPPSALDELKRTAQDWTAIGLEKAEALLSQTSRHLDLAAAGGAVLLTTAWRFMQDRAQALAAWAAPVTDKLPQRAVRRGPQPTWQKAAIWAGWGAGAVAAATAAFMVYVTWDLPSTDDLWADRKSPSYVYVDIKGRVILREGSQNAPPVDLNALPPYVAQAVLAIEDKRFYQHLGVDLEGLTRAAVENVQNGRVVQGGSTITQQLAKNLFLTNERTFRRKAQEVALALWLEGRFSKDEILALYLSRVFFGAGAWGVEAASERYFDKPASKLTLGESALLAGLLKAPSRMNPAIDPTLARERRRIVLAEMVSEGFITPAQREAAEAERLAIKRRPPSGNFGYFREWIDAELTRVIGEDPDDFIIETTIDLDAQRAGERAIDEAIRKDGETLNVSQGALISIDDDGGVRAMVGGTSFEDTQFNRTTQARRQPGSAFKFFIYLTALQRGLSPWSVRSDSPVVMGDWAPGNYDDEYFGSVPLTFAFAKSLNMVAIRVADEVGHQRVIETARSLGVRSEIHNYRSLALGAQEMTLAELTQSYAAVSNGGARVNPHGIRAIRRASSGNVIYRWQDPARTVVADERAVRGMNLLMSRVVEAGTGTRARMQGRDIGGKTGTTNDYKDAWFVGFSSGLTTGVWIGNDDPRTTKKVTGGSMPAVVWREFMQVALRDLPNRALIMPRDGDYFVEAAPAAPVEAVAAAAEEPALQGAPLVLAPSSGDDGSMDNPEG